MRKATMGIDVSSSVMAWTIQPVGGDELWFSFVKARGDAEIRRGRIFAHAKEVFTKYGNLDIWCEAPIAPRGGRAQNSNTTVLLGLVAGAVWGAWSEFGYEDSTFNWVNGASWKKRVLDNGNANKEMILQRATSLPRWPGLPLDECADLADAWCVMRYGIMQRDLDEIGVES